MKMDFGAVFEQVIGKYVKLPLSQKVALPVLLFGAVALILFITKWANQPEYVTLYSGLDDADAAAVVDVLRQEKVGYLLDDGGSTVKITPRDKLYDIKLQLSSAGLPKGGDKGFEIFKEGSFGRTSYLEQLMGGRALEGELERTIKAISTVRAVRVHITNPKRSVFVKKEVLPTASVLLSLRGGSTLTPMQIKGMTNLVAGAVERLTAENVTILDSQGNQLNSRRDEAQMQGLDVTRLDYQRRVEAEYEKRIESMLEPVLGRGRAVASVNVAMDFDQTERSEELFDPAGVVTRSERVIKTSTGGEAQGGVPGVISNLTNDPTLLNPPKTGDQRAGERESLRNFEISRAVVKTVGATGEVARVTAGVLVDGIRLGDAGETYEDISPEMLQKLESLVEQAIGFDEDRGDTISIENIKFAAGGDTLEDALAGAMTNDLIYTVVPWVVGLIAILLFLKMVVKPLVSFLVSPTEAEVDLSRLLPSGVKDLEKELKEEQKLRGSVADVEENAVNMEELETLLAQNSKIVNENPQQAALLIRYWVNEGRL